MYEYKKITNRAGGPSFLVVQVDLSDSSEVVIASCGSSGDANLIVDALNA